LFGNRNQLHIVCDIGGAIGAPGRIVGADFELAVTIKPKIEPKLSEDKAPSRKGAEH
jgi:hypothetical protein